MLNEKTVAILCERKSVLLVQSLFFASLTLFSAGSLAATEKLPAADLLGRTLGSQTSYERHCEGKKFPSHPGHEVFLRQFEDMLAPKFDSYNENNRKDFFVEIFYSSIETIEDCGVAMSELDSYWNAFKTRGFDKKSIEKLLTDTAKKGG